MIILTKLRWILLALVVGCFGVFATPKAVADEEEYDAATAKNISIPTDELEIRARPLTKAELEVEAAAWMELVKAKSREVSAADIAIKRKNKETKAAEGATKALETAKKATEKAAAEGDSEKAEKAQQKAEEALEEAKEAVQESADATSRSSEDEDVSGAIESADSEAVAGADAVTSENLNTGTATSGELDESASAAQQVAEAAAAQKTNLLDKVNRLREERVALVDRLRVVLNELDAKGGDSEETRLYLAAISGIEVDVSDVGALQATIIGWVKSEQGGIRWLKNILSFFAILFGFWIASRVAGSAIDRFMRSRHTRRFSALMQAFVSKMVRRSVMLIGGVVALSSLEVSVGPILAAIGAAGFVVAFALQDSLSNFASGIMILLYRPFDVGDVVDAGGVSGKVTSLNLVSVGINTFDNKMILVPNNKVWNDVIVNATTVKERRVDMVFGIGYSDDIGKAQSVLERILANHELVLDEPESVVRLNELADSSVNFVCRPWVKTADYWAVYWDVTRSVKEQFDAEGISIPFPQQDVHMHQVDQGNA